MKVSELKNELNKFNDDLECYVVADHGQTIIKSDGAFLMYIHKDDKDKYYVEALCEDEIDDFDEYIKICVISD